MRIISLDLSTKSSGYAIFEEDKLIGYGLIQSNKTDWRERLYDMGKTLGTLFDLYKPEHIYIEDMYQFLVEKCSQVKVSKANIKHPFEVV